MGLLQKDIHVIIQDLKDAGYAEMVETYETLENTYNRKVTDIDKLQREYEASIRTKARSQESIERLNYKIASLKDRENHRQNYYSINGRKSRSSRRSKRKLISYYKKLLRSFKRRNKMAKISERNLKKIIDKKLRDMRALKKDLKSYAKTIRAEYRSQKDAIKFIKEYKTYAHLIDNSCSKEVKAVIKKCIENTRNGDELPYNLTIKQITHELNLIKDCALKNQPIPKYMELTAAAKQYKEDHEKLAKRRTKNKNHNATALDDILQSIDEADLIDPSQYDIKAKPIRASKKTNTFVKGSANWSSSAFTSYHIDKNKLAQALQNTNIKDPVIYATSLGKMCIGNNPNAKGASKQMLLDKGLQILKYAINGNKPKTMTQAEEKAYKNALTLIKLNPNIKMDSYIDNTDQTQTHGQAQDRGEI